MEEDSTRRGSRTYCLKIIYGNQQAIVLQTGCTYKFVQKFLDNLEKSWKHRGLTPIHNRVSVKLSNGFLVWFEEEKHEEE